MPNYSRIALKMLAAAVDSSRENGAKTKDDSLDRFADDVGREQSSGSGRPPRSVQSSARRSVRRSVRRWIVGLLAVAMLAAGLVGYFTSIGQDFLGSASSHAFATAALLRIGMVLGALWLAWDSLKRPARWLPPGLAVAGVVGIVVVAAQPRLILAIAPALGGLALLTGVLRVFRKS